jgi:hypothetical protein
VYGLFDRANSGSSFDTCGIQFSGANRLGATTLNRSVTAPNSGSS